MSPVPAPDPVDPDGGGDFQPLDADLTAIAALVTAPFGRGLLTETDAASTLATLGSYSSSTVDSLIAAAAANVGKRARVRAATTANITIGTGLNNGSTLDGVTLVTGDLVLVKDQSTPAQNGVYVVGASPARFSEFDTYNEHPGSLISVAEGSTNADTLWLCTSNAGGTLDSTAIAFAKMVIAGELLASNNLSDLGNAATARTNLGVAIGTNVQAFAANLAALAALSLVADELPYANGTGTLALASFTSAARTFIALSTLLAQQQLLATQSINAQVGTSYTPVASDVTKLITLNNASAIALTLPQDSDLSWNVGDWFELIQLGAGQVTAAAGTGATLKDTPTAKARAQNSRLFVQKIAANTWHLAGDLAAS